MQPSSKFPHNWSFYTGNAKLAAVQTLLDLVYYQVIPWNITHQSIKKVKNVDFCWQHKLIVSSY